MVIAAARNYPPYDSALTKQYGQRGRLSLDVSSASRGKLVQYIGDFVGCPQHNVGAACVLQYVAGPPLKHTTQYEQRPTHTSGRKALYHKVSPEGLLPWCGCGFHLE